MDLVNRCPGGHILHSTQHIIKRLRVGRLWRVDVCLPMVWICTEELDVDFIMAVRCKVYLVIEGCRRVGKLRIPTRIIAVTEPATSGAATSYVTLPDLFNSLSGENIHISFTFTHESKKVEFTVAPFPVILFVFPPSVFVTVP